MKIAQVAPLFESVPPRYYGGTERVISYLTEELANQGHEVTLFAAGDSKTQARLCSMWPKSLRLNKEWEDQVAPHILMVEEVIERVGEFDFVHSHLDYLMFPFVRRVKVPMVHTLHGRLDRPEIFPLYKKFSALPLVSISNSQRDHLQGANWQATVYHGLPVDLHPFKQGQGKYLAFIGRMSPEKRLDLAIELAVQAQMPLKIAAKMEPLHHEYFYNVIRPLLRNPLIEWVGEINEREKSAFLGNALALIFPIQWPEPFGLVMIESMACGTPVIAYPYGSVPEIVDDGVTGFIVQGTVEALEALKKIPHLSRNRCREVFERRFSAQRMCADYLNVYRRLA